MTNQYEYVAHIVELYSLLEDKLSKDIFWARLRYDCEPSLKNADTLYELTGLARETTLQFRHQLKDICNQIVASGKKIFLYGAGMAGKAVGKWILQDGGDFYAYCARNHEKYTNGVNEKQVFSPSYVFEHPDECQVLVMVEKTIHIEEILNLLRVHHFPQDQIMLWAEPRDFEELESRQYFEFPELFPKGKAFVDGGCYDCGTSKRFAEWCSGEYSKILAFEPDPNNAQQCRAIADSSNLRLELIPSGLSDHTGTASFAANGNTRSFVIESSNAESKAELNFVRNEVNEFTIPTTALDDVTQETEIGFIKMDIEGSELGALHGAERTILRDKPLLAVCVYHKRGDVLAIMDYLHRLVPQYRFWLRHYGFHGFETVLYASVKQV